MKAARRPLLYASALRFRSILRAQAEATPRGALAFARSARWRGGGIAPTQAEEEVVPLLELLREEPPGAVVEIGTDAGGTLFLWSRVAAPDAILVAIDTRPLGPLGRRSPYALVLRGLARERQRVELLMPADSHDPRTLEATRRLLGGRPIDFLFIDGDHSFAGVGRDFELYAPLVRPGGLVAFHDVATELEPGVVRFWRELKETHETHELVARGEPAFGIGLYRVPSEPA